jgi:hypothetical protein
VRLSPEELARIRRAIEGQADFAFVGGLFVKDVRRLLEIVRPRLPSDIPPDP